MRFYLSCSKRIPMPNPDISPEACGRLLLSNVKKTAACWLWLGGTTGGYGRIIGNGHRERLAHRYSWIAHCGPIPRGMFILHKCDVKLCVRPDHLFLGTQLDNMKDCLSKGRRAGAVLTGESHSFAKLSDKIVKQMRWIRGMFGVPLLEISSAFGVAESTACRAISGQTWRHL